MINKIKISNYKVFHELTIEKFGRINLIAGKNNTGKSSLLEALFLYITNADISSISEVLHSRGEILPQMLPSLNSYREDNSMNFLKANLQCISSLFNDRKIDIFQSEGITIEGFEFDIRKIPDMDLDLISEFDFSIALSLERHYPNQVKENNQVFMPQEEHKISSLMPQEALYEDSQFYIGLRITPKNKNKSKIHSLNNIIFSDEKLFNNYFCEFIKTSGVSLKANANLWDKISLNDKKSHNVIDALRIIEPKIEKLAFVGDEYKPRTATIKLVDDDRPIPLQSMGDGLNRILTIILALVNCENGYLLIDEFENGLHYSVQTKLWEVIFKVAERLNVQVFATTHSNDCIDSFQKVINSENNFNGQYMRLELEDGKVQPVYYSKDELEVAINHDIETR